MITVLISRKECNERCNQWKAWMYVNNALLKYCKFYTGQFKRHCLLHLVRVKVKLEITWTSTVLNFLCKLAQLCVGSRQRNDVTRSIFCPNFRKLVTSILDLDLMNLSLKTCAWFNPIIQGIAILITNTSTTSHRDEWLKHIYTMHGKCNYEIEMPEEPSFS